MTRGPRQLLPAGWYHVVNRGIECVLPKRRILTYARENEEDGRVKRGQSSCSFRYAGSLAAEGARYHLFEG
jgi:hypothetical protein